MPKPTYVLGISAFYHDSACALLKDGFVVAAAQEERFTRKKHDDAFPKAVVNYCLKEAGINIGDICAVVFYEKPFLKFERLLETYIDTWPWGVKSFLASIPLWVKNKIWMKHAIQKELNFKGDIYFTGHHEAHAASAFYSSPYDSAAILTVDAVGEIATTSVSVGNKDGIKILYEQRFPHSLGLFYSAFTYWLGFKVNSAEYKVMGLAPYGKPLYVSKIKKIINIKDDGSFSLDRSYFSFEAGLKMTSGKFDKFLGGKPRKPDAPLTQYHKDIAKSLQEVTNEIMLKMAGFARDVTGEKNLCLAGGVALNCVANEKILKSGFFEDIFVQPAAGDAGGALGAAFIINNKVFGNKNRREMKDAFLGPEFSDEEIEKYLEEMDFPYEKLPPEKIAGTAARLIYNQAVLGWFQGRMEWGPRALGHRSILADPTKAENRDKVNLKIKFRESFRPFAPSVTEEDAGRYFDFPKKSPFMLFTAPVFPDKRIIPAVTHIDGSARFQTVSKDTDSLYHDLHKEFEKLSGAPVLINTSFNVRGEPIVCSPADAVSCFMRTDMDYLIIGPYLISKEKVRHRTGEDMWKKSFESD